jgi:hypothetical protein
MVFSPRNIKRLYFVNEGTVVWSGRNSVFENYNGVLGAWKSLKKRKINSGRKSISITIINSLKSGVEPTPECSLGPSYVPQTVDNLTMLLQPFVGPRPLFQFLYLYTFGRTPWTGDQHVARPLPTHRINPRKYPCLEWDSNSRSKRSRKRRQFMP